VVFTGYENRCGLDLCIVEEYGSTTLLFPKRCHVIQILEFERKPIVLGEQRQLVLTGDGPFMVTTSCFVDSPPPPGFRPCAECSTSQVGIGESLTIEVSRQFWARKTGAINIEIKDSVGEVMKLRLAVITDSDTAPTAASAGA